MIYTGDPRPSYLQVVRDQVTPEGAILKKLLVPPPLKRHTRGTAVRKPLRTSSMDVQSVRRPGFFVFLFLTSVA